MLTPATTGWGMTFDGLPTMLTSGPASGPLVVTTVLLPNGTVGTAYEQPLAASGGQPFNLEVPYSWTNIAGALPPGLTMLYNYGVINGTPMTNGTFNFTVQVTDAAGNMATQVLVLQVSSAVSIPRATFKVLHTFANGPSDGRQPEAGLILSGNTLFGTMSEGGPHEGTVFAVNTDGTGYKILHYFGSGDGAGLVGGGLILSGNTLYGTTQSGGNIDGIFGDGTVFAINTNGSGYRLLHTFPLIQQNPAGAYTNSDGASPMCGLILSGNTLYGTANEGGTKGYGTVFAVNTNGMDFTVLHTFTANGANGESDFANSDGAYPIAGLILSGNTLYGTTSIGGTNGGGTVFAINTDGTGFTVLYSLGMLYYGDQPYGGLVLLGNTLYGTTTGGGDGLGGVVFAVNTNGTGYENLYPLGNNYNIGNFPQAGLFLSSNTLYGTTYFGGSSGDGTVFAINTNGSDFMNLHTFTLPKTNSAGVYTNSDGANPQAGLILSGNTLYGTAKFGGSLSSGTVFSINLALNIQTNGLAISQLSGGIAQLTYLGTPGARFALDWAHGLNTPIIWTPLATNTTTPDGYLIFTNTASGSNDFYRIRSVP